MQLVRLAWLNHESYIRCPECGKEAVYDEPCDHLLFIYGASEGEFAYVADSIYEQVLDIANKAKAEEAGDDDEEEITLDCGAYGLEDELVALPDSDSRVVFLVATGGLGNPSGHTSYVAFDIDQ